jgi:peptide/nickel transport system permease protein
VIVKLIASRLAFALVTLVAVSAFVFVFTEVLPGDIAARVLGRESSPQQRRIFRHEKGLDRPVQVRYADWLAGATHGDFGKSLVNDQSVGGVLSARVSNTLLLAVFAFVLYIPVTLGAAILSALYRDRLPDSITSFLTLVGLSLPEFVLGTILIFVFGVQLGWFPALSFADPSASFGERLNSLVLPAVTLMVGMAVYAIRMLRDNLIEVLDSEYVRMATLKGVPRWRVVLRHALPNALGPGLNVTALNLTYLIGGIVVVERVFSYQGLGQLLVDSIFNRDTPVVEAVTLLASAVYIGANLLADLAALLLNPRLRAG